MSHLILLELVVNGQNLHFSQPLAKCISFISVIAKGDILHTWWWWSERLPTLLETITQSPFSTVSLNLMLVWLSVEISHAHKCVKL